MILVRLKGSPIVAERICGAYLSLLVGSMFWTVTDAAYDIINWLSHPLEYGRAPDEIYLLATRTDGSTVNRLWRYRYDDQWDVGITGFVTFAFEDQQFESKTPDEIFDAYLKWYKDEEIEEMHNDAVRKYLNGD